MKDKEPKMAQYLARLTWLEQQIICNRVRLHSGEQRYAHLHPGLLPFIPVAVVRFSMSRHVTRPAAVILAKLPGSGYVDEFIVALDPKKVHRMFGPHPERGKVISWLPKQIIKGKTASPVVALKRVESPNVECWQVLVAKPYRAAIYNWLYDVCGH